MPTPRCLPLCLPICSCSPGSWPPASAARRSHEWCCSAGPPPWPGLALTCLDFNSLCCSDKPGPCLPHQPWQALSHVVTVPWGLPCLSLPIVQESCLFAVHWAPVLDTWLQLAMAPFSRALPCSSQTVLPSPFGPLASAFYPDSAPHNQPPSLWDPISSRTCCPLQLLPPACCHPCSSDPSPAFGSRRKLLPCTAQPALSAAGRTGSLSPGSFGHQCFISRPQVWPPAFEVLFLVLRAPAEESWGTRPRGCRKLCSLSFLPRAQDGSSPRQSG